MAQRQQQKRKQQQQQRGQQFFDAMSEQQRRKQQQHDFLEALEFEEKNEWRIGMIAGFVEQNIGLYHLTDKQAARYGLPEDTDRLADNDIIHLVLDGHHRAVFGYILDRMTRELPQEYQVVRGEPVRREEMRRALLDLLRLLQFPKKTYERYDFPRLFLDTPFQKKWRHYVLGVLAGRSGDEQIVESFILATGDDEIRRFLALAVQEQRQRLGAAGFSFFSGPIK